jgi:hypothetical protein
MDMRKRSGKQGKMDLNKLSADIVNQATNETHDEILPDNKNPAAVAFGRLGGLKGGEKIAGLYLNGYGGTEEIQPFGEDFAARNNSGGLSVKV